MKDFLYTYWELIVIFLLFACAIALLWVYCCWQAALGAFLLTWANNWDKAAHIRRMQRRQAQRAPGSKQDRS
jgi:hypothetical protein